MIACRQANSVLVHREDLILNVNENRETIIETRRWLMSVKEAVLEIVKKLPAKCTWDDVLYQIYVRKQIEAGLDDEASGRLIPHESVVAKYAKKKSKP